MMKHYDETNTDIIHPAPSPESLTLLPPHSNLLGRSPFVAALKLRAISSCVVAPP